MFSFRQKIIFIYFVFLLLIVLAFYFHEEILRSFISVTYDLFIKPPERSFCLDTPDPYQCITDKAIQDQSAKICYYLDASGRDRCIDEITLNAKDKNVCSRIWNRQSREYCLQRFK